MANPAPQDNDAFNTESPYNNEPGNLENRATELQKRKAMAKKEQNDYLAKQEAGPKTEFAGMEHPEIGELPEKPAGEDQEEEEEEGDEEGQPGQVVTPEDSGPAGQQQAQRASQMNFFGRMAARQMQTKQAMLPFDRRIRSDLKAVNEIDKTIKKNDQKIASAKRADFLGCCIMAIPGLGWIIGIIVRILRTKSKVETKKAEIENRVKRVKMREFQKRIRSETRKRQRLARQAMMQK